MREPCRFVDLREPEFSERRAAARAALLASISRRLERDALRMEIVARTAALLIGAKGG